MAGNRASHGSRGLRRRWPPLQVLIVAAALLISGTRLMLIGAAGLAGWRHVLRDFKPDLERPWPEMLDRFMTPTGASILWALGGGLCVVACLGLWARQAWGQGLARALILLALVWHALGAAMFTENSVAESFAGLLNVVFAVALLAILHDPRVGAWLSSKPAGQQA